jgi:RimJ/RimL family protein N-acetyltransferase
MALVEHWPLFGLRVTTPRLELRSPTDDDLAELIDRVRAGIHDPATMPFTVGWTDAESPELERSSLQYWWRARADFSPQRWDLALAVAYEGRLVGVQSLTAVDFVTLRTAETGSWLGLEYHGRGIGTEMRSAVLHLAFEHLGAEAITSAAFTDNLASQRVSLANGYELNGTTITLRRGERAEQIRFLITRDRWLATRRGDAVEVTGFDTCRPMFGL